MAETIISGQLPTTIKFRGRRFDVDMDYRNVLFMHELFKDKELTDEDKADVMIQVFIRNRVKLWGIPNVVRHVLLNEIVSKFVNIKMRPASNPQRTMDFAQDAAAIYSSFWQAYRIDLQKHRLDWREFMALLQGLPSDTLMKEIIRIRTEPIPKATKDNSKQIHKLIEAKNYYAIELSEEERREEFQRSLDKFASNLAFRAKKADSLKPKPTQIQSKGGPPNE